MVRICRVVNLGLVDYLQAWDLQKALAQKVADGDEPDTLLMLQHPHVYTIGRRGSRDDVLLGDEGLGRLGASVYEVDRGGEATYHGPGQLVAYPIVNIRPMGGPLKFVRALEQTMIRTLADYDIDAATREGCTGVWAGDDKIGAIGLKVSRGIASHGLSLNVDPDLSYYEHVIPCGSREITVTSMARLLGHPVDVETVAYTLQYHFARLLGLKVVEAEAETALSLS